MTKFYRLAIVVALVCGPIGLMGLTGKAWATDTPVADTASQAVDTLTDMVEAGTDVVEAGTDAVEPVTQAVAQAEAAPESQMDAWMAWMDQGMNQVVDTGTDILITGQDAMATSVQVVKQGVMVGYEAVLGGVDVVATYFQDTFSQGDSFLDATLQIGNDALQAGSELGTEAVNQTAELGSVTVSEVSAFGADFWGNLQELTAVAWSETAEFSSVAVDTSVQAANDAYTTTANALPGLMQSSYEALETGAVATKEAAIVAGGAVKKAGIATVGFVQWAATGWRPEQVFEDCGTCPEMVRLPTGQFTLGDLRAEGRRNERPTRSVTIDYDLAIGRYEVTQDQWVDIMGEGSNKSMFQTWSGDRPVDSVNWDEARTFIDLLNEKLELTGAYAYRLPTEAEWEYAARGGHSDTWWCGEDRECLNRIARYTETTEGDGTDWVGRQGRNPYGLYDMHGNVAEWTADCYREDAYSNHGGYPAAVTGNDAQCPHVVRGGAWNEDLPLQRTPLRRGIQDGRKEMSGKIGFRLARTLPPAPETAETTPAE